MVRHRGGGRDEDGRQIPASELDLVALAVAPGGGTHYAARQRDGEQVACVVYFATKVDIRNGDELSVRGRRHAVIVNDWRSPWTGRGGLEVLCTRSQG